MKISIYLHNYVTNILKMFGPLNLVINKIIDENIDSCDLSALPPAPDKTDATRYTIDVENETYIALVEHYGATSNKCGIRRLIYYFVDNEMYDGWETVSDYIDSRIEYMKRRVKEIKYICKRMTNKAVGEEVDILNELSTLIDSLEEIIYGKSNK